MDLQGKQLTCPLCSRLSLPLAPTEGTDGGEPWIICGGCGAIYITDDGVAGRPMTSEEKAAMRAHPTAPAIRATQNRILERIGGG